MELPQAFVPYVKRINQHLLHSIDPHFPVNLREPTVYFLNLPGKKIRPLITLFACLAVGGNLKDALPAATAVELFHDFTLIHDDIMDQDELRRGFQTMHVKYGDSTAILVGDALIGIAYQQLMKSPARCLSPVMAIFTEALVKVCEGQALDKEFESREVVSVEEYLEMIDKKTAWLIKVASAIGAICGGGSAEQIRLLRNYGNWLGLGFQIQDDLLDFVADESKLGKEVGSDFRMHKKTYVTLKYGEMLQKGPRIRARYPSNISEFQSFPEFQKALRDLGVVAAVQQDADQYIHQALQALVQVLPLTEHNLLYQMTRFLQSRQY